MSQMEVSGPASGPTSSRPGVFWTTHRPRGSTTPPSSLIRPPPLASDEDDDEEDDDEPRLLIADDVFESSSPVPPRTTGPKKSQSLDDRRGSVSRTASSRNDEAIESLLLLGQRPVIAPPPLKEVKTALSHHLNLIDCRARGLCCVSAFDFDEWSLARAVFIGGQRPIDARIPLRSRLDSASNGRYSSTRSAGATTASAQCQPVIVVSQSQK